MRVLIIAQYFPPDMGGGATRAFNAAKGLKLNGCEVTVICAHPHYPNGNIPSKYRWKPLKVERFEGMKVVRVFVPPMASRGIIRRLILFLTFMTSSLTALPLVEADVVWAANPNVLSVFPGLVYGRIKRCPLTLNVDDLWPEELYNLGLARSDSILFRLGTLLAGLAYSIVSLITLASPGYVKPIVDRYNVSVEKTVVVRAGVDIETFAFGAGKKRSDKAFRVLYSGAFSVAYDFDQVLLAAERLQDEGIEIVLQGSGELLNHLKGMAERLKPKSLKIMGVVLSRKEVAGLLAESDALLLPLRDFGRPYLGISSKIYEYQAAGKPVICCADGEPARYIRATNSGIVVKPGDAEGLAKAMVYLKDQRAIAQQLGECGRAYAMNNVSLERVGEAMCASLETLTRSPKR